METRIDCEGCYASHSPDDDQGATCRRCLKWLCDECAPGDDTLVDTGVCDMCLSVCPYGYLGKEFW